MYKKQNEKKPSIPLGLWEKKLHVPFKPAHEVTSLKQSQVLKGHPFLVLT